MNSLAPTPEQFAALAARPADAPVVMVNLLKFKPRAEYEDGSDSHLTGAQSVQAVTQLSPRPDGRTCEPRSFS